MTTFFPTFHSTRRPVSSGMLGAVIQLQRQDLLTGLVDVVYPGGEQALLLFNLGVPIHLFYSDATGTRKILHTQWGDIFGHPNGSAAVLPLGGDSLRLCLMALEADHTQVEELQLRPGGLAKHFELVKAEETVSLFRVRDEAFSGLVAVPGSNVPAQDALVFTAQGVLCDSKAISYLASMEDRLLRITKYEPSFSSGPVQEYALRMAFLALTAPFLGRFEQLAGSALVNSLGREVNNYAYHQGWKIQFFGKQIQHRQFFPEAAESATVYRSIYRLIQGYTQRVVGRALASSLLSESVKYLPAKYRAVFESQNFLTARDGA